MDTGLIDNPFPGLRPFDRDDHAFFFGRDRQIDDLHRKLKRHRFTAVVGRSGDGKSSLVKAGLIPKLERLKDGQGNPLWIIEQMTPQASPLRQLAQIIERMTKRCLPPDDDLDETLRLARSLAILRNSSRGLLELLDEIRAGRRESQILLLVDQFEEIFDFDRKDADPTNFEEATLFVDLILRASRSPGQPIHVMLTMRSDYLGDCPRFHELPEAMNDSQFLVPRLNRTERRQVIEQPIHKLGAEIQPALLQQMLNDAGDVADMLPVLQHVLIRTWAKANEDWQRGADRTVKLANYADAKKMSGALNTHAEEVLGELTKEQREIAHGIFMALVDVDPEKREIRRVPYPRVKDLAEICGVAEAAVCAVIEAFRAPGRNFLMPPPGIELDAGTVVYVSHEALLRRWATLQTWLKGEQVAARFWRAMVDILPDHDGGEIKPMTGPRANERIAWFQDYEPRPTWTQRYGGRFAEVEVLIETSIVRRRRDRTRQWMLGGTIAALCLAVTAPVVVDQLERRRVAQEERIRAAQLLRQRTASDLGAKVTEMFASDDAALLIDAQRLALTALLKDPEIIPRTPDLRAAARKAFSEHFWHELDRREFESSGSGTADHSFALALDPGRRQLLEIRTPMAVESSVSVSGLLAYDTDTGRSDDPGLSATNVRAIATSETAIAIVMNDSAIRLIDPETRAITDEMPFPGDGDLARLRLALSADGKTLAAMRPGSDLYVWRRTETAGATPAMARPVRISGDSMLTAFAVSADGLMVASAYTDRTIRMHTPFDSAEHREVSLDFLPLSLAFAGHGTQLGVGGSNGAVALIDPTDLSQRSLPTRRGAILDIAFSPSDDDLLATVTAGGSVRLQSLVSGGALEANVEGRTAVDLAFSERGRHLFVAFADGTKRQWIVSRGIEPRSVDGRGDRPEPEWVRDLRSSGRRGDPFARSSADGRYRYEDDRDDVNRRRGGKILGPNDAVIARLIGEEKFLYFRGTAFDGDRDRLLTLTRGAYYIWEWVDPHPVEEEPGFFRTLWSSFLRSSPEAAATAEVQEVLSPIAEFSRVLRNTTAAAFSPDGREVGVANRSDDVRVWPILSDEQLIDIAVARGVRPMDNAEVCRRVWPQLERCPITGPVVQ